MKSVILSLGVLLTAAVSAKDLPVAKAELITELKQYCTEMASEYGTENKPLKKYLLDCVNEELASEGFKALTKLD
ncbi:hypothetical protein RS130_05850 [Paraglaciecola aquimarina]|uniref:Uncharacterized protein n=1 Tax=Paraglaciecola aquimarina TaxID=1235557 RepID=A0ABU3SU38_9ALTE|nr:hypothetical protein [Paraglaciecola aquimarina]MDU0353514.1 hypothetical protein [Paraglaciecola aquimarina]